MKLSTGQLDKVEQQLGVEALPEENPAMPQLKEMFGDHTFFVDAAGLNIVEPIDPANADTANVVKLAAWTEDGTHLNVHEPEALAVAVDVPADGSGEKA